MKQTIIITAPLLILALVIAGCSSTGGGRKKGRGLETHTAVVKTTLGDFELEFYGNDAPKAVANFIGLANQKFYEGILVHRVVPGFVIQFGDPKTKDPKLKDEWGLGGGSIYNNATFADELNPNAPSYQRGYVEGALAMANRGPNTNTSQVFVCLGNVGLPHSYTIFGQVTSGMDVVHKIEEVKVNGQGVPDEPVEILSITTTTLDDN